MGRGRGQPVARGGGVCTPGPIASPYRTPQGVAKRAAWGFYPHVILAYETYSYKADVQVLAADPDAPSNRWILPYWRLLAAIDMSKATVYNLPSVNVVAATCSKPEYCLSRIRRHGRYVPDLVRIPPVIPLRGSPRTGGAP